MIAWLTPMTAYFDALAAIFRAFQPETPAKPPRARKSWETIIDMGAPR